MATTQARPGAQEFIPAAKDKIAALEAAGIKVAKSPAEMGRTLVSIL